MVNLLQILRRVRFRDRIKQRVKNRAAQIERIKIFCIVTDIRTVIRNKSWKCGNDMLLCMRVRARERWPDVMEQEWSMIGEDMSKERIMPRG